MHVDSTPTAIVDPTDTDGDLPKLTKEQKRQLFYDYDTACAAIDTAQELVVAAIERRRQVVQQIAERVGKGPFTWQGERLTVASRNGVYFFRGQRHRDTEMIG